MGEPLHRRRVVEALTASQFLAAGLMLLLAGWLLLLSFENRLNRAFALFLTLRAGVTLANTFQQMAGDAVSRGYWESVAQYFLLGVPVALAYFLVAYTLPRGTLRSRVAGWSVLAAAVAVEAAYVWDHCLVTCRPPEGRALGPLAVLTFSLPLADAAAAWVLLRDASQQEGPRRASALLLALGFALNATVDGALAAALILAAGFPSVASAFVPSPLVPLVFGLRVAALLVALAAVTRLLPLLQPQRRGLVLALVVLAAAIGAFVGADPPRPPGLELFPIFVLGFARMLLPALATYALVRHRLFDLDVRLKWTLSKSPLAGAFVVTFVVASEMARSYLDERLGWLTGGLATALLFFFLAPLERVGHRLAKAVLPNARPLDALDKDQRLDLYRSQADLAWADGALDRSERILLDQLRERLGITVEEAAGLERQAMVHQA